MLLRLRLTSNSYGRKRCQFKFNFLRYGVMTDSYISAGLLVEEAEDAAFIISVYFCLCFVSISVTVTNVLICGWK